MRFDFNHELDDKDRAFIEKHRATLIGRLVNERAADLSDEELERVLARCVGGWWLPQFARALRDANILVLSDITPQLKRG